jgi:hypothetical protein
VSVSILSESCFVVLCLCTSDQRPGLLALTCSAQNLDWSQRSGLVPFARHFTLCFTLQLPIWYSVLSCVQAFSHLVLPIASLQLPDHSTLDVLRPASLDSYQSSSPTLTLKMSRHATITQSYQERASLPNTSPVAAYLLRLIATKQTNLCVSADVSTTKELLQLAEEVGDSICMLKTHADIINDFGPRTIQGLKEIAAKKHFLIFEDRKFGDIGSMHPL